MSDYSDFLERKKELLTSEIIENIEYNYPTVVERFKLRQFDIAEALTIERKKELLLELEKGISEFNRSLYPFYNGPNNNYIYNGYDGTLIYVHFYFLYKEEYEKLKLNILEFSSPILKESLVDYSESNLKEKIIALKELGIIDYLQKEFTICQTSTNKIAEVLSLLTGEKSGTIQSYINPMINEETSQNNNPYNNIKTVEKTINKLIEMGVFKSK